MNRVCRRGAPLVVVLAILAATNCACCSPTSHHGERCFLEIGDWALLNEEAFSPPERNVNVIFPARGQRP